MAEYCISLSSSHMPCIWSRMSRIVELQSTRLYSFCLWFLPEDLRYHEPPASMLVTDLAARTPSVILDSDVKSPSHSSLVITPNQIAIFATGCLAVSSWRVTALARTLHLSSCFDLHPSPARMAERLPLSYFTYFPLPRSIASYLSKKRV